MCAQGGPPITPAGRRFTHTGRGRPTQSGDGESGRPGSLSDEVDDPLNSARSSVGWRASGLVTAIQRTQPYTRERLPQPPRTIRGLGSVDARWASPALIRHAQVPSGPTDGSFSAGCEQPKHALRPGPRAPRTRSRTTGRLPQWTPFEHPRRRRCTRTSPPAPPRSSSRPARFR